MRAVICRAWGPVDDLKLEDVAPPTPGPGQLVIDIKATGVNYADSIMVAGRYQTRPPFPFSPGLATAGVVTRRGGGGDRQADGRARHRRRQHRGEGGGGARARRERDHQLRHGEADRARHGAHGRSGRRRVLRPRRRRSVRRRAVLARLGRTDIIDRLRRGDPEYSRQPAAREAPGGARLVVTLLPLARAGQAPSVCRRAARVVREGHAEAARHTSAAARARRRGHSPAQRPQGARQGRHHAGASRLMELRAEQHGPHVVVVAIDNQPRRNAMPRAMMAELATLWDRLERDGTCRCIVLTGAGARPVSSGADLSGDLSADPETARVVNHALLKNRAYAKPIVAAVNGDCVAGGLELLLSTDVRAAAPHARFGLPEVRWSIYPFGGATVKLVQQIGYVHAMELLLTARLIDAAEAARIGLVNRVVPADALMPWALGTAETIAANSPTAVQAVKQQISSTIADHAASREALEQELGDRVRKSDHFKEGVRAFLEKRNPNYT